MRSKSHKLSVDLKCDACSDPWQTSCLIDLAPHYGCGLTDTDCTCNNADLTVAAGACIGANCTVREALLTQRITSNTCGVPVRNRGQQCREIMWSLFMISIVFVALRFLARTKRFDGPGFGADDWTMLVVLAFLFPHEIGLEMSESSKEALGGFAAHDLMGGGAEWPRPRYMDD